jgi:DNA helicase-2/ATP-dependent DNA helicase PcrA
MISELDDDHFDDPADDAIRTCVNLTAPQSFFLYAGAGSGKTRSLVDLLRHVSKTQGRRLSLAGQQIAVITYTNAACDEIKQRLEYDSLIDVRTIHSFAWSLIEGYNNDIRRWVSGNLLKEIAELEEAQAKGRAGTKAAADRERAIASKRWRYASLREIRQFTYSPTGDSRTRDSLSHSEVIAMTSEFLTTKPALRRLLVGRFPLLLIDESQDTNARLMDALLHVQAEHRTTFCVGLFGDTMQRIYADGKTNLAQAIPETLARPKKHMNHRCPSRVTRLINKIRADDDGQEQRGRSDKPEGLVRLFILPENTSDKLPAEARIRDRMAELTGDQAWTSGEEQVKMLTLEHHMAARRFGFDDLFEALYPIDRMRTGFLNGTAPGITFFTRDVLPVVQAMAKGDRFRTAALVRQRSPLLDRTRLQAAGDLQLDLLKGAKDAIESLQALFTNGNVPTLLEVLNDVARSELLAIPDQLAPFVQLAPDEHNQADRGNNKDQTGGEEDIKNEIVAWRHALGVPFAQIEKYDRYIRGLSQFDTHQGVKGLEFPRVMVVISDEEARGFLFNFEKLFGAKEKTKADYDNEASGRETSLDRTRRLFYVTCSRTKESLAIVYYSSRPNVVKEYAAGQGWFDEHEVELFA